MSKLLRAGNAQKIKHNKTKITSTVSTGICTAMEYMSEPVGIAIGQKCKISFKHTKENEKCAKRDSIYGINFILAERIARICNKILYNSNRFVQQKNMQCPLQVLLPKNNAKKCLRLEE